MAKTTGGTGEPEKTGEETKPGNGGAPGGTAGSGPERHQDATTGDRRAGTGAGQGGARKPPEAPPEAEPDEPQEDPRKTPRTQHEELVQFIHTKDIMNRIRDSLPRHLTPERWISVLLTLNAGSDNLRRCTPKSIVAAAIQGAVLGLDFNKTLREAFLIPRRDYDREKDRDGRPRRDATGRMIEVWRCDFMPGYAGLRKLVMNGGDVLNVRSALVYEGELTGMAGKFVYQFSPDLEFIHQPCVNPRDRGAIALAYAVAKLKTGEHVIEIMTIDEVEKSGHHRSTAYTHRKGAEQGPWVDDYDMMVRKTVLKRLCNQLPMSPEVADALDADNRLYQSSVALIGQQGAGRRALERARAGRGAATLGERLGSLDPDDGGGDGAENGENSLDGGTSVDDTGQVGELG